MLVEEKLVVTAFGRGVEVGTGTAVGLSWFPVGTVIHAGRIDLEIVAPFLVACSTRKVQRSQRSLIICKVAKAHAGGWLGQQGMVLRRPNCVNRSILTFGESIFCGANMGIDCPETVVLCGRHSFDKTLLQHSLGSLEGLIYLLLLCGYRIMERFEYIVKLLSDPSSNLAGSGMINILIQLCRQLCGNHGVQLSKMPGLPESRLPPNPIIKRSQEKPGLL